jgi:hypothetical protein
MFYWRTKFTINYYSLILSRKLSLKFILFIMETMKVLCVLCSAFMHYGCMVVYCGCTLYLCNMFVLYSFVLILCNEFLHWLYTMGLLYDALWLFSIVVQSGCLLRL